MIIMVIYSIGEITKKTSIYDILEFITKDKCPLNEIIPHLDNINYKIDLKNPNSYYYRNIDINAIKLLEYYNINLNLIDCKTISCLRKNVIEYLYNNNLYNFTLNNINFYLTHENFETIFTILNLDVTTFRLNGLSIYSLSSQYGFYDDFNYIYKTYNILPTNEDYKLISNNNSYILYKTLLLYDLNMEYLNSLNDKYKLIYISQYYNVNYLISKDKESILMDLFDTVKDESIDERFITSISCDSIQKIEESINLWKKIIIRIGVNKYVETCKKYEYGFVYTFIIFYSYYDYYIDNTILEQDNLLEKYNIKIYNKIDKEFLNFENDIIINFYIKLKNTYNVIIEE